MIAKSMRKVRHTGSLTTEERALAANAEVPTDEEQLAYLAKFRGKVPINLDAAANISSTDSGADQ
jgi:hypothetical protein